MYNRKGLGQANNDHSDGLLQEAGVVTREYAPRIVLWIALSGALIAALPAVANRLFPER